MPHLCTNCGQSFPDGSKEMLSGCPECGGNKFQYLPESALDEPVPTEEPPDRPGDDGGVTDAVGRAATTVRDYVNRRRESPDTDQSHPSDTSRSSEQSAADDATVATDEPADDEDVAQASARSEMIEPDDLPGDTVSAGASAPGSLGGGADDEDREVPPSEGRVVKEPDSPDRPGLEELRKELNDQFESIRILEPGQYELNLMELYDREEHIIALQEDGRYIIEVPDTWRDDEE